MPKEQVVIGILVALLCAAGLINVRWVLHETRKGQQLEGRFGEEKALWVLRGLFGLGLLFGILLATGVIRPVQW